VNEKRWDLKIIREEKEEKGCIASMDGGGVNTPQLRAIWPIR